MPSLKDLRNRISSVKATRKITKAMQMVAASKMRKAQEAALSSAPFAQRLYRLQRLVTTRLDVRHPFLEARPIRLRAVILVAGDKGLCGALNTNVLRLAMQFPVESTVFVTAGRKAAQFVSRSGRHLAAEFSYGDSPVYGEARAMSTFVRDLFLRKEIDEARIVTTRFVNTLVQEPVVLEYLPIGEIRGLTVPGAVPEQAYSADTSETIFEPDRREILGSLVNHYLNVYLYYVLLHAKASEQSARMVAMKNATDNAEALIKDLTLEYNTLRQGNITKELLEIAAGSAG